MTDIMYLARRLYRYDQGVHDTRWMVCRNYQRTFLRNILITMNFYFVKEQFDGEFDYKFYEIVKYHF